MVAVGVTVVAVVGIVGLVGVVGSNSSSSSSSSGGSSSGSNSVAILLWFSQEQKSHRGTAASVLAAN